MKLIFLSTNTSVLHLVTFACHDNVIRINSENVTKGQPLVKFSEYYLDDILMCPKFMEDKKTPIGKQN